MAGHIRLIMKGDKKKWRMLAVSRVDLPSVYGFMKSPLDAGLWCLYVSKDEFGVDYITYEEIQTVLQEYLDIPITIKRLQKAFAPVVGKKIIKSSTGEGLKISSPGETYFKSLKKDEPLNVLYVNPNKPRTARRTLESLIRSIPKGELLICDPFYGLRTLEVLEAFAKHHKKIRFLTARVGGGEKQTTLNRAITDFKKEHSKRVEMRVVSHNDLHDRYIISTDQFLIVGHGIKDLGDRESLIVVVQDRYGKDIRKTITANFEQRWSAGSTL